MEFFATTVEKVSYTIDHNPYLSKAKLHLLETYNGQKTYKYNLGVKIFVIILNIIILVRNFNLYKGFTIFFPALCHELDCPYFVFLYPCNFLSLNLDFYLAPAYFFVFIASFIDFKVLIIPYAFILLFHIIMSLTTLIVSITECTYDYILKITSLLSFLVVISICFNISFEIYEIIIKKKTSEEIYQTQMDEEESKTEMEK